MKTVRRSDASAEAGRGGGDDARGRRAAARRRVTLGGILSGHPDLKAMILFLLLALALGLAGGYLLSRRYPPSPSLKHVGGPASHLRHGWQAERM